MNTLIKLATTMLILNLFMYMAVNFAIGTADGLELNKNYNFYFEGDLIDQIMTGNDDLDKIAQDTKENWTSYGIGLNANFTATPSQEAGTVIEQGVNFLDSLKIVWDFIKLLFNIIVAPLALFFNFRMPVFIGLMVGIPYFFMLAMTIFAFIRGVGD